jgi:hypothetical protein
LVLSCAYVGAKEAKQRAVNSPQYSGAKKQEAPAVAGALIWCACALVTG